MHKNELIYSRKSVLFVCTEDIDGHLFGYNVTLKY